MLSESNYNYYIKEIKGIEKMNYSELVTKTAKAMHNVSNAKMHSEATYGAYVAQTQFNVGLNQFAKDVHAVRLEMGSRIG